MCDDHPRRFQSGSHKECWPEHSMEPQNVLTNDVSGGRPSVTGGGKLGHSEVVQEGIQPNINLKSVKNIIS